MEYKLIKKFLPELKIEMVQVSRVVLDAGDLQYAVLASDLEAELAKGVEVFGNDAEINNADFTSDEVEGVDTHSGLLIGYQPLQSSEPVSREEIQEALSESAPEYQLEDLPKRILENGVK